MFGIINLPTSNNYEIDYEKLKNAIIEFWKADNISKTINNETINKSHPKAYHTSHLLVFKFSFFFVQYMLIFNFIL